ncbi:MAG TPA: hypothetical protein VGJ20_12805 [Xanthobacteraceae bacterium]
MIVVNDVYHAFTSGDRKLTKHLQQEILARLDRRSRANAILHMTISPIKAPFAASKATGPPAALARRGPSPVLP